MLSYLKKNLGNIILISILTLLVGVGGVVKAKTQRLSLFVEKGCPHCAKVEEFIRKNNLEKEVEIKEIRFNNSNRQEFIRVVGECGIPLSQAGVPLLEIKKGGCLVGDRDITRFLEKRNIEEVAKEEATTPHRGMTKITLPAVVLGAAVDAINPCAFAVLIVLMMTVLAQERSSRKEVLSTGFSFILSIFISYFLMGIGIYKALATLRSSVVVIRVLGILAIILGVLNLKDYFYYGGFGFKMEVPDFMRPRLRKIINSVTSPLGAFLVGFGVSLFLLPCTSGLYVVILGMLSSKEVFRSALAYLILYNLIFISPMVAIVGLVYKGAGPSNFEKMRQKNLRVLHLFAAILMIFLGLLILY